MCYLSQMYTFWHIQLLLICIYTYASLKNGCYGHPITQKKLHGPRFMLVMVVTHIQAGDP